MIPATLGWLRSLPEGREWLERLPTVVAEAAAELDLQVGEPAGDGYESLVLHAARSDGTAAVLKVPFLGRENFAEADALELWSGNGAVRLLARDRGRRVLLLERCVPGRPLAEVGGVAALDVLARMLPRLWIQASNDFGTLADEAAWWAAGLPLTWERAGRPFERSLLDAALDVLDTLPKSQGEQVLLHQDLHGGNVLSAEREPWLVIDPKPLVGEREFGLAPIVRSRELGPTRADMERRLDHLTSELGLDRDRARGWALAQAVAWCFEGDRVLPDHLETARWLVAPLG